MIWEITKIILHLTTCCNDLKSVDAELVELYVQQKHRMVKKDNRNLNRESKRKCKETKRKI